MTDDLATALGAIIERFERLGIPYMVVGSVAGLAHGRARATQDFDVVAEFDPARLEAFVTSLPEERYYVSAEAARDALRRETLFNVIDLETGWKVDVVPRKSREFSRVEFSRRRPIRVLGREILVASREDTILAKLEWSEMGGGSARQLEDVRALLGSGAELDLEYVECWIQRLGLGRAWSAVQGR